MYIYIRSRRAPRMRTVIAQATRTLAAIRPFFSFLLSVPFILPSLRPCALAFPPTLTTRIIIIFICSIRNIIVVIIITIIINRNDNGNNGNNKNKNNNSKKISYYLYSSAYESPSDFLRRPFFPRPAFASGLGSVQTDAAV